MQTQFEYITGLAKQYKALSSEPKKLFDAINDLPQNVIEDITRNLVILKETLNQ